MSTATVTTPTVKRSKLPKLTGKRIFIPDLRPEPMPVRAVEPSPCTAACPAGIEVKSYVSLIAEERFEEALEVIRRHCPLPAVCGRICHHPCETACRRGHVDEAIAIRALKRFVTDQEVDLPPPHITVPPARPQRVAVIGSGPAGLTAAYDLRRAGFPVTVFEAAPEPGGMLRYGIAEYRLPRDILDHEIDVLLRTGIEIQTGRRLGQDLGLEELLEDDYHAVLLATGAPVGRKLGIPGEDEHDEVEDALSFLRRVNEGDHTPIGRRVAVIGGGSTAVEAARAARRLGAQSVDILYRRSRTEVLAADEEVVAAEAEGIRFRFLVAPQKVLASGKKFSGIECLKVGLGDEDASGRRRPMPIPGTEFAVKADRVLAAVGQVVDLGFLPSRGRTKVTKGGHLEVDGSTMMTKLKGVFAAGDLVSGPATVVDAIATGHNAALSIKTFLETGRPVKRKKTPARTVTEEYEVPDDATMELHRVEPKTRAKDAARDFLEAEQAFTRKEAVAEARRCRRCGPCSECRICAQTCHRRHVAVHPPANGGHDDGVLLRVPAGLSLALDAVGTTPAWVLPDTSDALAVNVSVDRGEPVELRPLRARFLSERCRGCNSCVEACPFDALTLTTEEGGEPRARLDAAACRGCALCTAVCDTHAALSCTHSPEWWTARLRAVKEATDQGYAPHVVVSCAKRNALTPTVPEVSGVQLQVVRLRCAGQLTAGMLMELLDHGAPRVLVAGCENERCRFGDGAALARREVERARTMLALAGEDIGRITADWSPRRAWDGLEHSLSGLNGPRSRHGSRPAAG